MGEKNRFVRCYGQRKNDKWFGVCLELNIAAEADSLPELKEKINSMISSYVEAVCDTDDKASIPGLLKRRAPLVDWFRYCSIWTRLRIAKLPDRITFHETMPFKLAHEC